MEKENSITGVRPRGGKYGGAALRVHQTTITRNSREHCYSRRHQAMASSQRHRNPSNSSKRRIAYRVRRSRILEPKEIRSSCKGGPYATRTIFGWVVNGLLGRTKSSLSRTTNFINADLELSEQFQNYCNMEI